jgi:hypothetical protein
MSRFDDPSLQIWFIIAAFGAVLIALGIASTLMVLRQLLRPRMLRDHGGPMGRPDAGMVHVLLPPATTLPSPPWCMTTTPGTT